MPPTDLSDESFADAAGPAIEEMQYLQSYRFIFDGPKWFLNLVLTAVCQLIPIVGPIVTIGYQFEILEALHRRPRDVYPEFDFNRFVEYLSRGIWPFLVGLVAAAVLSPLLIVLYFGSFFAIMAIANSGSEGIVIAFIVVAICLFAFVVMLALSLILYPMTLRAGLMQDFGGAFNFQFIKDFISLMWREMMLVSLFTVGTSILLVMAGYLAFCVGVYLSVAAILLSQAHLEYQLYEVYLSRGGEPIPFKTDQVR